MILWSSAPDTGWQEPGRGGRSEFSCTGPRPPPETPRSTGRRRSRDQEPGDNNNNLESCYFSKVILFSQTLFDKCSLSKQCQLRNKSCFQYLICKNRNAIKVTGLRQILSRHNRERRSTNFVDIFNFEKKTFIIGWVNVDGWSWVCWQIIGTKHGSISLQQVWWSKLWSEFYLTGSAAVHYYQDDARPWILSLLYLHQGRSGRWTWSRAARGWWRRSRRWAAWSSCWSWMLNMMMLLEMMKVECVSISRCWWWPGRAWWRGWAGLATLATSNTWLDLGSRGS